MRRIVESGQVVTIDLATATDARVRATTFQVHHEEGGGRVRTSSVQPPTSWDIPLPLRPGKTVPVPDVAPIIAFAEAISMPSSLHYTRVLAERAVLDPLGSWLSRCIDVFALTGRISLVNGRYISIGWSGFGNGTDRLTSGADRDRLCFVARAVSQAAPIESAEMPAILAPQAAALIVHEAVGHFAEGSPNPAVDLKHRLGCRLAGDGFDVFDDPTFEGPARYSVDDDGIATFGPTRVLADGVLVNQLHSRTTAARAERVPTANARASQVGLPPIPRMSNLIVPPGTYPDEALVENLWSGLIVHHLSNGFSTGLDVKARLVLAEEVSHGRRTGRFFSGGLVNERVDVLTRCLARGHKSELNPNALCGKAGQILYDVGTVAPAMHLSTLRIGA